MVYIQCGVLLECNILRDVVCTALLECTMNNMYINSRENVVFNEMFFFFFIEQIYLGSCCVVHCLACVL